MCPGRGCVRRGYDAWSGDIEGPCKNECDWEPDEQQHDHHAQRPVWQFPRRKRSRRKLDDAACCDDVSHRHLINLSPLHFLEEAAHNQRLGSHGTVLQRRRLDIRNVCGVHFTPAAKTVWKCGLCFSRETTLTSMSRKPFFSSSWCNCTSLKPSQWSAYSSRAFSNRWLNRSRITRRPPRFNIRCAAPTAR